MWILIATVTPLLTGSPVADRIVFNLPEEKNARSRIERTSAWIERHVVQVNMPDHGTVSVVAWKDPTLDPDKPQQLAGYLITDTLWSAYALRLTAPSKSQALLAGLKKIGWTKNKLHEVLFEPVDQLLHQPADEDFVHGHSIGIFPSTNGRTADLRVFRHQWNQDFDIGHPLLFAEHAVYRSLDDWWKGKTEEARARLRPVFALDESRKVKGIFWDEKARIVVDHVNRADWIRWRQGDRNAIEHYSFKGALLIYAARVLELDREYPEVYTQMKERLWSAQNDDGGIAHFLFVDHAGKTTRAPDATGEACAIAILADTVGLQPDQLRP
jgi:hypothetical protein